MDLVGKTFRAVANTASGTINTETTMTFRSEEEGALLGSYCGGTVAQGSVIALRNTETTIEMLYHCLTTTGDLKAGRATGTFELDADRQLHMRLNWQWLTGDQSTGQSDLVLEN